MADLERQLRHAIDEIRSLRIAVESLTAEQRIAGSRTAKSNSQVLLSPDAAMARIGGYTSRTAFIKAARKGGLRRVMINRRVIRYDANAIEVWLRRRAG